MRNLSKCLDVHHSSVLQVTTFTARIFSSPSTVAIHTDFFHFSNIRETLNITFSRKEVSFLQAKNVSASNNQC